MYCQRGDDEGCERDACVNSLTNPLSRLWKWLFASRAGEAHLRALLENTPDFILEINRQGNILYINHLPEIYLGKNIRQALPTDQYEPAMDAVETTFTSGTPQTITLQTIAPNGQITWDSIRLGPIKQGKTVTSLTVIVIDITAQKSAEATLRELESRHRGLLENIPAITYLIDHGQEPLKNPTIYVSPQIVSVSGYSNTDFLNDPQFWTKIIHQDDLARVMADSERADRTGESFVSDYRIINKENKILWFHDESALVKDENDQPLYRVGVWSDITERKQAEIALQQLENMYRRAIDAAGAVPYILSHDGTYTFTFIGDGILTMTGYSASEWTSELWESLVQGGFPRGNLAHLTYEEADRITNNNHSILWECDYYIRTRDGQTRWIADTSVKGFDEKGENLVSIGIYQDITERKLAEKMQAKLIRELEQRNAELERLAYTLSHELKSPLITIRGFVGFLREDALSGNIKRLEQDIERVSDGTKIMQNLINELVELMSVGQTINTLEEIPFRTLVGEAVEHVQEKFAEKNIKTQIADNLPHVYGDRKRLLEVLQSLFENSIKFMGEQSKPQIEIGQRNGKDNLPIFYIRDNGIGIEPRFTDRIFGIFDKLDSQSEGTGIGLALVKRIIEVHGGRVWVESEGLGKGSTFCFTIPNSDKPKEFNH